MDINNYELVWGDDFDYEGAPDINKWTFEVGNHQWPNNELQAYTNKIENAYVKNGKLTICSLNKKDGERKFTSAKINTSKSACLQYGYFEVKAKFPVGPGSWPAIWLMPVDKSDHWPACGEIDLAEHIGRKPESVLFSLHSKRHNHQRHDTVQYTTSVKFDKNFFDDFHIFSMEWTKDYVEYFIDGKSYCRYNKNDDLEEQGYDSWPFDKPYYLILNTAVGGGLGGPIDISYLPYKFEIEYVHIYQKKNIKSPA